MNFEREIEQVKKRLERLENSWDIVKEVNMLTGDPEKAKEMLNELLRKGDTMAEIKGKVDRMEKEMDSHSRWQTAGIVGIYTLCAAVIGSTITLITAILSRFP